MARSRTTQSWRRLAAGATAAILVGGLLVTTPTTASAIGCTWRPDAGSGTAADPYQVADATDLDAVRNCLDKHFVQTADVTLAGPFTTLGDFTGSYDGGSHSITGMTTVPGMFESISGTGRVHHLTLKQSTIEMTPLGQAFGGALAGTISDSAEVTNVSAEGVTITGFNYLGGLIGAAQGPVRIAEVTVSGSVISFGHDVGGVVGLANRDLSTRGPTITDTSFTGTVRGDDEVGGIVGTAIATTLSSVSASSGALEGDRNVGGLVGYAEDASVSDATVTALAITANDETGGAFGVALTSALTRITSHASVTAAQDLAGGLAGAVVGTQPVTDSVATGEVRARSLAGGLVGVLAAPVARSSAGGAVTATDSDAGGLVGMLYPAQLNCDGAPDCEDIDYLASVDSSTASGAVSAPAAAGGIAGRMPPMSCQDDNGNEIPCRPISEPYAAKIVNSYARGAVTAPGSAGGLVGTTEPPVLATAAGGLSFPGPDASRGVVTASATQFPLGVINSYSSGVITGTTRGGIVAEDPSGLTVVESFWDATTNPDLSGGKGVGKTAAQLRDITTFADAGWKIQSGAPATGDSVWGICVPPDTAVNSGYPFLLWQQPSTDPCHPVPAAPVLESLTPGDRKLRVAAQLGADGGNPITSVQYQIDDGDWRDSGGTSGTFTITGLTNGTLYRVRVRSVNAIGISPSSNRKAATPAAATVLKVNAVRKGKRLAVKERNIVVRSVRTNGTIRAARVSCSLKGSTLPRRLTDRLCAPTVAGATAAGGDGELTAAQVRRKKLRITVTPRCSTGLRVRVAVTAKAPGAKRKTFTRSYRVDNTPPVKCRIKGTG